MPTKFVTMEKDGERLEVHPDAVAAHKAAGWKVVEKTEAVPASESEPAAQPPAQKKTGKK